MNNQNKALKNIIFISLFAAIIAVCSWISIPTTVPFTLQTFALAAAVCMLGTKRSTIAVIVYILLGAVGVPVFAGFKGGIGALMGMTGGYIIGFILMTIISGILIHNFGRKFYAMLLSLIVGLVACYAFGTAWFIYVYTTTKGSIGIISALSMCVFPYIIPDIVKFIVAILISNRLYKFTAENKE